MFSQFPFSPNNLNMKMCTFVVVGCTFSTHDEYYDLARSIIYYGKKWSGQLSNHSQYDLCIRHSSKRLSYFQNNIYILNHISFLSSNKLLNGIFRIEKQEKQIYVGLFRKIYYLEYHFDLNLKRSCTILIQKNCMYFT